MTNFDRLRANLHARAGIFDQPTNPFPPSLEDLRRSEWSPRFERLQRNRLVMGAMRYGKIHAKGKPRWDRVPSMVRRLRAYQETGNVEMLVDVANLCLLEFEEGRHPKRHFSSDDTGEHVASR